MMPAVADEHHVGKMVWPRWATWSLVAVVLTTLLTVAVVINDIF